MRRNRFRGLWTVLALTTATGLGCGSNQNDRTEASNPSATDAPTVVSAENETTVPPESEPTVPASVATEVSRTITVDGVGKVAGPPDFMETMLGVVVTRPTILTAVDDATAEAETMIEALRALGITDADLQTGDYSIYPQYFEYPAITGYTVNYNVRVHVRELARGGEIIDAAIRAVGDDATVYGVSFGLEEDGARMTEARQLAFEDARHRAEELAGLVDGTLRDVVSVEEVSVPDYGAYYGGEGEVAGAPFMPGEVSTSVTVTVTFAME